MVAIIRACYVIGHPAALVRRVPVLVRVRACTGSGACPRTIWTARSCACKPWALDLKPSETGFFFKPNSIQIRKHFEIPISLVHPCRHRECPAPPRSKRGSYPLTPCSPVVLVPLGGDTYWVYWVYWVYWRQRPTTVQIGAKCRPSSTKCRPIPTKCRPNLRKAGKRRERLIDERVRRLFGEDVAEK